MLERPPSANRSPPHADHCGPGEAGAAANHERRTWWVAAVNFAAMAAQVVGGVMLGSAAVLADGVHMGAHVGAVLMAGLAYRVAAGRRECNDAAGARRVEDAAALFNALFLFVLAALIASESWNRLLRPHPIAYGPAVALAAFGLLVNAISVLLLQHRPGHAHTHGRDLNFRAIYLHMLGDAGVGVLALFGLSAVEWLHWSWADPATGFAGAALVAVLGARVLSPLFMLRRPEPLGPPAVGLERPFR